MCILLSTTEHPDFPFLLLSNRDEYFRRPTQLATFRPLDKKCVLSPLDLARAEHGSWIGVTTGGKLAVLVNYREESALNIISEVSRGILPVDFISSDLDADEWYQNIEKSLSKRVVHRDDEDSLAALPLRRIGGFSLVFGQLKINENGKIDHLNIISNRGDKGKVHDSCCGSAGDLHRDIGRQSTFGLSNSLYYEPWKKVELGRELLRNAVQKSVASHYSQEQLIDELFGVLSTNTFDEAMLKDTSFEDKLSELQNTIFVPPLETGIPPEKCNETIGKYYGTRTQTIIALDKKGVLHYYERDLYGSDDLSQKPVDHHYKFDISNVVCQHKHASE